MIDNINDNIYTVSDGIKLLTFFLVELFSNYDIYTIQDLKVGILAYSLNNIIPIQWKLAIEFAIKNVDLDQGQ